MSGVCEVGILFADVAGSTRIYEILGDKRAFSVINQSFRIMSNSVAAHGGMVVKTIGDELMAAFRTPTSAFAAAVEIQRRMTEMPPLPFSEGKLRVQLRMGFHFGTALREHDDFFGDTVNIAARIVSLAKANQILTTGDVVDVLPPNIQELAVEFAQIEVKGRAEAVRIAQIRWDEQQRNATIVRFATKAPETESQANLVLVVAGKRWEAPLTAKAVIFGRDPECDFVLASPAVSRHHATIERRRGKIFLIDHSTNGTTLIVENRRPTKLIREEFSLTERGKIVFGRTGEGDGDEIDFEVT
jgi:class 3 adenylate cyclase